MVTDNLTLFVSNYTMSTSTLAVQDFTSFGETDNETFLKLITLACQPCLTMDDALSILSDAENLSFEKDIDIDGLHFLMYRIKVGLLHDFLQSTKNTSHKDTDEKSVYFIKSKQTNLIKIGYATNVFERIKQLSSGNTDRLILLKEIKGGRKKEAELHKKFSNHRKGGEWFYPDQEILDFIDAI